MAKQKSDDDGLHKSSFTHNGAGKRLNQVEKVQRENNNWKATIKRKTILSIFYLLFVFFYSISFLLRWERLKQAERERKKIGRKK